LAVVRQEELTVTLSQEYRDFYTWVKRKWPISGQVKDHDLLEYYNIATIHTVTIQVIESHLFRQESDLLVIMGLVVLVFFFAFYMFWESNPKT
jgi:hypothetical protein